MKYLFLCCLIGMWFATNVCADTRSFTPKRSPVNSEIIDGSSPQPSALPSKPAAAASSEEPSDVPLDDSALAVPPTEEAEIPPAEPEVFPPPNSAPAEQ